MTLQRDSAVLPEARTTTRKTLAFPLNVWYAAAWAEEVTRQPMARTIAGRPLALYRTEEGEPVALADACWHRLAPLSLGKTVGSDGIRCPYHGIVYNAAGRCISMPAQEGLNPSATVPSFAAIERHDFVWVWLGDPDLADTDSIPDMSQMTDPEWAGKGKTIHVACNFQLILDNLMDLTHEEFVHADTIGQAELSVADFEVEHTDTTVIFKRVMEDIEAPPFLKKNFLRVFPDYDGAFDRWQVIRYEKPATIRIDVGVAKAGTGALQGDRSQGITAYVMNTITPETATTSHYFWSFRRKFLIDDADLTEQIRDNISVVFGEDEAMLIAQQAAIEANPDYEFYSLNIDAGGMWVRRIIEAQLTSEGRV